MRKNIVCFLLVIIFAVSLLPNKNIFAEGEKEPKKLTTITSVSELRKCLQKKDRKLSEKEKLKIKQTTDTEVLQTQQKNEIEEALEIASQINPEDLQIKENNDSTTSLEEKYTLSDGGTTTISLKDEKEQELLSCGSYTKNSVKTKNFGNRLFTATVVVEHSLYPDSKLYLKFHYSIGKYGLRARYAESASDSYGVVTVSEGTPKITDKYAQKNGNDINAVCSYKVSISVGGWHVVSTNYHLDAMVKLIKLYSKSAKVYQHTKW